MLLLSCRLFLVASVLALKMNEDECYSNYFYAKVGGVSVKELNYLESLFLSEVEFDLHVTSLDFSFYEQSFLSDINNYTNNSSNYDSNTNNE